MKILLRRLTAAGLCASLLAGSAFFGNMVEMERSIVSAKHQGLFYLPPPAWTKAVSLGNHLSIADIYWIKAEIYMWEILVLRQGTQWLRDVIATIAALDPHHKAIYIWGGAAFLYNGTVITKEAVENSNWILELGHRHFPQDWEIPFMLAINYFVELRDIKNAAHWMAKAAATENSPPHVRAVAAKWLKQTGSETQAIALLKENLLQHELQAGQDQAVEAKLIDRLSAYASEQDAKDAAERFEAVGRRYRDNFPYLPFLLFLDIDRDPINLSEEAESLIPYPLQGKHRRDN